MALIHFSDASFNELSLEDWYAISSLRQRVFVVEQHCPYLDADGKDVNAHHITGRNSKGDIVAYARIVPAEDQQVPLSKLEYLSECQTKTLRSMFVLEESVFKIPAIRRIVLDGSIRGKGQGDQLMDYTLKCYAVKYPNKPVFISAQKPLHDFYVHHGFVQTGHEYLEDEIPHIPMIHGC